MPGRAYTEVIDEMLRRIQAGAYVAGGRLPAERHLADQLEVSRSTLREGLAALELMGVIETHVGAGSYVVERSNGAASAVRDASPADIIAARLELEPRLARATARCYDREGLAAIARPLRALERLTNEGDAGHPTEPDRRFHSAIARATGNPVLVMLAAPLWELMEQALWNRLKEREWSLGRTRQVLREHQAIYDAIRSRDDDRAAFEMERHLRQVQHEIFPAG